MTAMRNQLELTTDAASSLRSAVDTQLVMRHALDLIDLNDLTFLKSVLYRYRDDRTSITLRIMFGSRQPDAPVTVLGFIALPKQHEPEPHTCTSAGGVALAGFFDEITRSAGSADALATLIKVMNQCLSARAS